MRNHYRLYYTVLILSLINTSVHAELTAPGAASTYTNERGSFTYYDKHGEALPEGTILNLNLDGRVGDILNENGDVTGSTYATKALAAFAKEKEVMATELALDEEDNIIKFNQEDYNEKNFTLTSLVFGALDVGEKYCKPAGTHLPNSLENWWKAVKEYRDGEIIRDKIFNDRIAILTERLVNLSSGESSKDLQVEAIQTQIELVNVSIDSIAGTNLFQGDDQGEEVSKTGRLQLREKLVLVGLKSISLNLDEDLNFLDTFNYRLMSTGLRASYQIAKQACEEPKPEAKCVSADGCKEGDLPIIEEVQDCQTAMEKIQIIESGSALDYMTLYLLPQAPSKELNEKLESIEISMKQQMAAVPKSSNSKFDWSTPMESALEKMIATRKKLGVLCPSTISEKDYDRSTIGSMAKEATSINVPGADKITESADKFLTSMGVTGESAKLASENLIKNWNLADLIIGQSHNRIEYYQEFVSNLAELIEMDRVKLGELVNRHKDLTAYLAAIKMAFQADNQPSSHVASSSPSSSKNASSSLTQNEKKAITKNQSSAIGAKSTKLFNSINDQNKNQEILFSHLINNKNQTSKASNNSAASRTNSSASKAGVNNLSFARFNLGITLSGKSAAVAKKHLSDIKNGELKVNNLTSSLPRLPRLTPQLTTTKNQVKSDTSVANNQNTDKASASTSFGKELETSTQRLALNKEASDIYQKMDISGVMKPDMLIIEDKNSKNIMETAQKKVVNASKIEKKKKETKAKVARKRSHRRNKNGNIIRRVYNAKTGQFDEVVISQGNNNLPSESNEENYIDDNDMSDDERSLAHIIAAKKKINKNAYDANEADSLFSRVTKAYIRNYEKVHKIQD